MTLTAQGVTVVGGRIAGELIMEGGSIEPQRRNRQFRWLIMVALITGLATCFLVESMRWRLPPRYLFEHLDIHRTGLMDYP
jgi:hypothetical protein